MNDKEMLELAAKAAGLLYIKPTPDYDGSLGLEVGSDNPMRCWTWNPLKDDGDALRLAVDLDLIIKTNVTLLNGVIASSCQETCMGTMWTVPHRDDKRAATRRAIVTCAAELGRNL